MVSSRFSFRIFTLFFYYLYFFCHFYTYSSLSTSFHRLHKFRLWNMNLHHLKNIFLLFILLFVICYPMYCANELVYLLKLLGYYLISDCWWHTHKEQRKNSKSSQSYPCWVVEVLPALKRCVSDVLWNILTEKSYNALSDPEIQAGDRWTLGWVGYLLSS